MTELTTELTWTELSPGIHIFGLEDAGPVGLQDRFHGKIVQLGIEPDEHFRGIRPNGEEAEGFNLDRLKDWVEGKEEALVI